MKRECSITAVLAVGLMLCAGCARQQLTAISADTPSIAQPSDAPSQLPFSNSTEAKFAPALIKTVAAQNVPVGTPIAIRLQTSVSSATAVPGQQFDAILDQPLVLDGELYMGTFALSPDGHPRIMEMYIDEGPDHHQGKTARCLYDLAPDALRWCAPEPGSAERLTAFPPIQDKRYLSMLFRREQPQPRGVRPQWTDARDHRRRTGMQRHFGR